jgi:hypothetical protein
MSNRNIRIPPPAAAQQRRQTARVTQKGDFSVQNALLVLLIGGSFAERLCGFVVI